MRFRAFLLRSSLTLEVRNCNYLPFEMSFNIFSWQLISQFEFFLTSSRNVLGISGITTNESNIMTIWKTILLQWISHKCKFFSKNKYSIERIEMCLFLPDHRISSRIDKTFWWVCKMPWNFHFHPKSRSVGLLQELN